MSQRKKHFFIPLVALLLLGVMAWWLLVPKEPSYQGRTLTEWQDVLMGDMSSVRVFRDYGAVQLVCTQA
jgi:hypothetical protein